jgi:hypothetical protein
MAATEKRFVVRADEKLIAFVELESVVRSSVRATGEWYRQGKIADLWFNWESYHNLEKLSTYVPVLTADRS